MSNLINSNYLLEATAPENVANTRNTGVQNIRPQFKAQPNDTFESTEKKDSKKTLGIIVLAALALLLTGGGLLVHKGGKTLGKEASIGEKFKQGWEEVFGGGKAIKDTKPESKPKETKNPYENPTEEEKKAAEERIKNGHLLTPTKVTKETIKELEDGSKEITFSIDVDKCLAAYGRTPEEKQIIKDIMPMFEITEKYTTPEELERLRNEFRDDSYQEIQNIIDKIVKFKQRNSAALRHLSESDRNKMAAELANLEESLSVKAEFPQNTHVAQFDLSNTIWESMPSDESTLILEEKFKPLLRNKFKINLNIESYETWEKSRTEIEKQIDSFNTKELLNEYYKEIIKSDNTLIQLLKKRGLDYEALSDADKKKALDKIKESIKQRLGEEKSVLPIPEL